MTLNPHKDSHAKLTARFVKLINKQTGDSPDSWLSESSGVFAGRGPTGPHRVQVGPPDPNPLSLSLEVGGGVGEEEEEGGGYPQENTRSPWGSDIRLAPWTPRSPPNSP